TRRGHDGERHVADVERRTGRIEAQAGGEPQRRGRLFGSRRSLGRAASQAAGEEKQETEPDTDAVVHGKSSGRRSYPIKPAGREGSPHPGTYRMAAVLDGRTARIAATKGCAVAKVLVVENDPVFAAVLEDRLRVTGHQIQLLKKDDGAVEAADAQQ